ncbi:membrane lipoprotein TmpC precursor [bacterium BMS3Abin02]|nr:membrane lipoprotein TmpC precursor [bacterium BMS3Abin02]GBE23169.1 membrane lipoprotein TmpC precursor [bacterium BMS3Bbin01]
MKIRNRALLVLVVFALIAAACSSTAETTTTTAPATTTAPTTTAAPLPGAGITVGMAYDIGGRGDKSFNDAAARGLDKAKTDFGIEAQELEPTTGGENREENLRLLSEAGDPLIFAIGFAFADGVTATAADFPDIKYAIVDSVVDAPNVASLVFAEEQGSYLVGAAAALKSKTGKIGFIGGVEVDLIKKFEAGYIAGAKAVNPDIEVMTQYLTQPPDFSGFGDPAKGKEAALAMFQQGADVVYHAAGGSGGGLFQAAKEYSDSSGTHVWAIGVDSDQYLGVGADLQPYILTSMLKRVDTAVYDTTKDFVNGTFTSGVHVFDLKVDGVGYATSGGFIDDIVPQLEDFKAKIISGEITVPTTP